ncbi:MarR family transcriptional regulator [Jannaschia sp. S6380]|uniref:MarR family winged helix-turn-helix transcriptional regulator n=1 Tax=Jannaschia sp. S6380 TaxID=2926408 RepID=UPI001FF67701|nr:MarR family transcriptional regulator [Jannaschia sp. S6380]MCK0166565.1 MarR family transcriptional regulator [Jannaschia sp. S6380]
MRDFLPYLLTQAAEEISEGFRKEYRTRYGMLRTDWRVLFHLGRYGPMTASEIGARSHLHKTKISRAVARLERSRMLRREPLEDRRQDRLALTNHGTSTYETLSNLAAEYNERLLAGIGEQERERLMRWLRHRAKLD